MRDPFLPTSDGTRLFHLDWGRGAPVVFVHAWSRSTYQGRPRPTSLASASSFQQVSFFER
ncbi:hypothetical protein D187_006249 [Cystobacter fuscus DSM 2262]|uniref:Alpha/beta hydrolase n=1 Tax=Cystobacter fuscus (strain ATCC 25194 / DSM 2262 / NBRC 100088 / M29) TaxID=1242864 RepID=S9QNG3_CYSF2|nr:hypothetical protein [Cystobacter fuscus]EPX62839.1 hypothetical protein D187_006249 [Cystobacter fuscus DSM 2262]